MLSNSKWKRLSIHAVALFVMLLLPMAVFAAQPKDVATHWAKAEVMDWANKGFVKSYPDGSFKPDNNISRAEFMALVNGAFGYKDKAVIDYKDVSADKWFADAVAVAKAAGYITGYSDGTIKPNNPITRQEAAIIIMKIKKLQEKATGADSFGDAAGIPGWSKGAVGAVASAKIMGGYPDGTFKAGNLIKRAEAVVALNKALTAQNKDVTYDKAGTYGKATGNEVIEGNVTVNVAGVTLQNMTIKGNLVLAKGVAEGNVILKNVVVNGTTDIRGGGENSIFIIDSTLGKVTVTKENDKIRIVVSGNSKVAEVLANSGVKFEEKDLTGEGFKDIIIDASDDDKIILIGNFESVDVKAAGVIIDIPVGTTVQTLTLRAKANITGTGTVQKAVVSVSGVTFQTAPQTIQTAPGVTAPTVTSPVSSGGSGGGSSTVAVTGIKISVNEVPNVVELVYSSVYSVNFKTNINGTLQMLAEVLPTNATNKGVDWAVTDLEGKVTNLAQITSSGLLTVKGMGEIYVKAYPKVGPILEGPNKNYGWLRVALTLDLSGVGINVAEGNITGTSTAMQYSLDTTNGSDGTWIDCTDTNTAVTFTVEGKVYVRAKAQPANFRLVATIPNGVSTLIEVFQKIGSNTTAQILITDADKVAQNVDHYKVFVAVGSPTGVNPAVDNYATILAADIGTKQDIDLTKLTNGGVNPFDGNYIHFTVVAYNASGGASIPGVDDKTSVIWDKSGPTIVKVIGGGAGATKIGVIFSEAIVDANSVFNAVYYTINGSSFTGQSVTAVNTGYGVDDNMIQLTVDPLAGTGDVTVTIADPGIITELYGNANAPGITGTDLDITLAPEATYTDAIYDVTWNTISITGSKFTDLAPAGSNVWGCLDWSKLSITGTRGTTGILPEDVSRAIVDSDGTLTIYLTNAKAASLEALFETLSPDDTLTINSGFDRDAAGQAGTNTLPANDLSS